MEEPGGSGAGGEHGKRGAEQGLLVWIPPGSLVFRDEDTPVLRLLGGPVSPDSSGEKVGEGQSDLLFPQFSQTSSALNIHQAQVPYFGVVCPKPHHKLPLCPSSTFIGLGHFHCDPRGPGSPAQAWTTLQ